jgi:hypothetical protein
MRQLMIDENQSGASNSFIASLPHCLIAPLRESLYG